MEDKTPKFNAPKCENGWYLIPFIDENGKVVFKCINPCNKKDCLFCQNSKIEET